VWGSRAGGDEDVGGSLSYEIEHFAALIQRDMGFTPRRNQD